MTTTITDTHHITDLETEAKKFNTKFHNELLHLRTREESLKTDLRNLLMFSTNYERVWSDITWYREELKGVQKDLEFMEGIWKVIKEEE